MNRRMAKFVQEGSDACSGENFPNELKPILLVEDVARILQIGPEGVRQLIRRRLLPAARLGRRYVIRREKLYEHLGKLEDRRAKSHDDADDAAARAANGLPSRKTPGSGS